MTETCRVRFRTPRASNPDHYELKFKMYLKTFWFYYYFATKFRCYGECNQPSFYYLQGSFDIFNRCGLNSGTPLAFNYTASFDWVISNIRFKLHLTARDWMEWVINNELIIYDGWATKWTQYLIEKHVIADYISFDSRVLLQNIRRYPKVPKLIPRLLESLYK